MKVFMDIITDTAFDTLKLLPFLFLTYLVMEYLENKAGEKTVGMLLKAGKAGPVIGGLLGVVPQCGFSAAAANLYSGGVISMGTMLAVFLSTSDEMLPILISERAHIKTILWILGAKIAVGILAGILVDIVLHMINGERHKELHIHEICERDHCHCEEGSILKSAVIHSMQIAVFIFLISFALNAAVEWVGMARVIRAASANPLLSILISALVGLLPNCASSVAITTLYLEGVLSIGSMFAGLLSCAGIGLMVLFRTNKGWKKNLMIVGWLYGISVVCGIVVEICI